MSKRSITGRGEPPGGLHQQDLFNYNPELSIPSEDHLERYLRTQDVNEIPYALTPDGEFIFKEGKPCRDIRGVFIPDEQVPYYVAYTLDLYPYIQTVDNEKIRLVNDLFKVESEIPDYILDLLGIQAPLPTVENSSGGQSNTELTSLSVIGGYSRPDTQDPEKQPWWLEQ